MKRVKPSTVYIKSFQMAPLPLSTHIGVIYNIRFKSVLNRPFLTKYQKKSTGLDIARVFTFPIKNSHETYCIKPWYLISIETLIHTQHKQTSTKLHLVDSILKMWLLQVDSVIY